MTAFWLAVIMCLLSASPAWPQLDKFLKDIGGLPSAGSGLNDAKIGSGLQEALKVGRRTRSFKPARSMDF